MKKLIALMFCLAVLVTVARAEYPKTEFPQTTNALGKQVSQQVEAAQRTVEMRIISVEYPTLTSEGKAILMGFTNNYRQMVLMATRDLSNEVLTMGIDDGLKGSVVNGPLKISGTVDYSMVNLNGEHLIKIIIPVRLQGQNLVKAKEFAMIPDTQAVNMAKKVQAQDDKAVEEYRKGIVIINK